MEKIKQALEKARQQRDQAQPERDDAAGETTSDINQIQYTKTRTISGSTEMMREKRLINAMEPGDYIDALKILSTQTLQRMGENQWGTLAVTSPRGSAGKTTIAINLGLSIAKEVEYTVLVVDANLREPNMHSYFGIEPGMGLSDYLLNDIELSSLLIHPEDVDHFVILPAGTQSNSSAELLGSPKMGSLVSELTSRYPKRIIIFDLPAVLETADALNFLPNVDSALLVIEDDETKASDLKSAVDMLSVTNVIGTVLNKSLT